MSNHRTGPTPEVVRALCRKAGLEILADGYIKAAMPLAVVRQHLAIARRAIAAGGASPALDYKAIYDRENRVAEKGR